MTSGSNKVSARVYPWYDLAWDLALADGMDPAIIESRFPKERCADVGEALHAAKLARDKRIRAMKKPKTISEEERLNLSQAINEEKHRHLDVMSQIIKDDENQWKESQSIQDDINTDIGTHLWRDILEGKVPVRKANGNPLRGESKQFQWRGPDTPHLTADEGNEWLKKTRYLQVWEPGDLKPPKDVDGVAVEAASCAATVATPSLLPSMVPVIPPEPVKAASDGPVWHLTEPKRYQGYGKPLYDLLKAAHIARQPCPKARDVLDAWKKNPPFGVTEVMVDGIKYYDANGNTKTADLGAIRAAINRMTQGR